MTYALGSSGSPVFWTEEPGGLQARGHREWDVAEHRTAAHPIFSVCSSQWTFRCFHVLAVVNSAAVNTAVHASFWATFFSGYTPRSGIAGSYGSSVFIF